MRVAMCCPSYKRPYVKTLEYIPFCRVYVDRAEVEAYKEANPEGAQIIACADGVQGNVCRVRNYILRQEFEAGADAVCIVDDDMEGLYLWVDGGHHTMKKEKIPPEDIMPFLEKYSILCDELGFKLWGGNCNQDAMSYRPYTPFGFSKFLGAPFQCFIKGNECYYDERLPLKEDYDMTLQQCNRYRGCLRLNFFTYNVKQSEQPGGCATYRTMKREKEQFELLQKKWGSEIIREDKSNKGHTQKQKRFDYNPILKVPIGGV